MTGEQFAKWFRDRYGPPVHEHVMIASVVQPGVTVPFSPSSTVVLWRCRGCSRAETSTLTGKWTLGEVRGEAPPPAPPTPGTELFVLVDGEGEPVAVLTGEALEDSPPRNMLVYRVLLNREPDPVG